MRTRTLFGVATVLGVLAVAPSLADAWQAPSPAPAAETVAPADGVASTTLKVTAVPKAPAPKPPAPAQWSIPTRPSFRPPTHEAPDVPYSTMCDERGRAYDIEPDTAAARARAAEVCSNLGRSFDDLGW
jgi:hypothetical protein